MHFIKVLHFVVVIPHNVVDCRLRFLNRISRLVNRHLVLLGRLRVLGQIQLFDGVIHLNGVRGDLPTCNSDLAVTQDQLLDFLLHQIPRRDHCERVVGVLLLRSLLRDLLRDFLRDLLSLPVDS